jgi:multiple sugar transport system permease protein
MARNRHHWTIRYTHIWFLAPAVLALLLIGLYPMLVAVVTSFRHYNLAKPQEGNAFTGFDNYITVLSDTSFLASVARTFGFLLYVLPAEILLGLFIALMLHKPGWSILRVVTRLGLVIPLATTYSVVGLIGRLLFNSDFGVINDLLTRVGLPPQQWLADQTFAFIAIGVMDIWQWTPFCALVLLAGLSMVPGEIEEAARLETRSAWRVLKHVQLPYLLPGLTAILILRTADILKLFDMVFVMTRGGPGSATELVSIYIQRIGFRVFDQGVASAQAILLLIVTILLSRLYIKLVYQEVA